ncbi:MAG: chemotaxis protein CheW [Undibacterium umbellatum]|uniref:chemotaxis protein CheW n=1 Tax=Undibacterium umbellatum TaxID=2762300 RepID=UPI003BB55EC8
MPPLSVDSDLYCSFVFCELNGLQFGVNLDNVVQALPRQENIQVLPRRDHAIEGLFIFGHEAIPLIDLRRWLPWPGDAQQAFSQVLILNHAGHTVAVGIHAVHGLQKIKSTAIQQHVHHVDEHELFHSTVFVPKKLGISAHEDHPETACGLLDVPALIALSNTWVASTGGIEASNNKDLEKDDAKHRDGTADSYAFFELQNRIIAINASSVAAVVPMPHVQNILGSDCDWLGIAKWRERDVPVLATLETLEINPPGMTVTLAKLLVIVSDNGQCVGLPVDEIQAIKRVYADKIQSPASAGYPVNALLTGICNDVDDQTIFLVDGAALVNSCPMSSLSVIDETQKKNTKLSSETFVVIQAGNPFAIALNWLEAIIDVPVEVDRINTTSPAQIGSINWKTQSLPLWDLQALNTTIATTASRDNRILIVKLNNILLGLLVDQLLLLLPARSGQVLNFSAHGSDTSQIIMTEAAGHVQSYRILAPTSWLPLQQATLSPAPNL